MSTSEALHSLGMALKHFFFLLGETAAYVLRNRSDVLHTFSSVPVAICDDAAMFLKVQTPAFTFNHPASFKCQYNLLSSPSIH